jgi:hypothetical protein
MKDKLKECPHCHKEKLKQLFHKEKCGSMYYGICEECYLKKEETKLNKKTQCSKCKLEKLDNEFAKFPNGNKHYYCLDCNKIHLENKHKQDNLRLNKLKECRRCNIIKSIDLFYNAKTKDGKNCFCKECVNLINKNWESRNPEQANDRIKRFRNKNRIELNKQTNKRNKSRRFKTLATVINSRARQKGFTNEISYLDLFHLAKKQKLRCAISGIKLTNSNLSVDHIIPYSQGGQHTLENIQLVDLTINKMKLTNTLNDFLILIKTILDYQSQIVNQV